MSSASISARGMTGMARVRAAATSGLVGFTADEITTTSQSPRCAASWPYAIFAPSSRRRRVVSDSLRSVPETR
jgi:hypothetical protein